MEKLREYWNLEIKELLLFTINDILVLSKEIKWFLNWVEKFKNKVEFKITVNWKPFIFSELSNYFYEKDFLNIPFNYINSLYKLLLELRVIWKKIEVLSKQEQISILDFVNEFIVFREEQRNGEESFIDKRFKDMIFMELWLDSIDKIGDATNETLSLLKVIMLKR